MSNPRIAITAIGMATSLGLDADVACGAARAGLAQPQWLDHEFEDDGGPRLKVSGHVMGLYTKGFTELGRWVRVASLGLQNLVVRAGMKPADLCRVPFYVNVPSGYYEKIALQRRPKPTDPEAPPPDPTFEQLRGLYEETLVEKIFAAVGAPTGATSKRITFGDEAGAATLVMDARETLARGHASKVIVGGVDSLVDPFWLPLLDEIGILKTAARPVGFMPGEGAAFLVLELESSARRRNADILACVDGVSVGREKTHRFAPVRPSGQVLAEVIGEALSFARGLCSVFYGDLNGDAVRAFDWGSAETRLRATVGRRTHVLPVESFGVTRAATGFISTCMAARAFSKGYAKSDSALVWLSSDEGGRGAIMMGRPA